MNVNPLILQLETETGLPVEQDLYTGNADAWITFTYEDERSALDADNAEDIGSVTVMVNLHTPKDVNYFVFKDKIKAYLTEKGFTVISVRTYLSADIHNTQQMRLTSFSATYQA